MPDKIALHDLVFRVGDELGLSDWITVDQARIDKFADATDDHQFIHVDPAKAAETPFGGTIAHGFLTLSLISSMSYQCLPEISEQKMLINYGLEKVRMVAPVRAGSRLRGRFTLADAAPRSDALMMLTYEVRVEIEGAEKPALTATWLVLIQHS